MWRRRDSNPHGSHQEILSLSRLPVSPRRRRLDLTWSSSQFPASGLLAPLGWLAAGSGLLVANPSVVTSSALCYYMTPDVNGSVPRGVHARVVRTAPADAPGRSCHAPRSADRAAA